MGMVGYSYNTQYVCKVYFGDIYVCKQCIMNGNCSFSLSLSLNCPLWLSKAEHSMWALNTHTQTHIQSSSQFFSFLPSIQGIYHTHIHIRSNQCILFVFFFVRSEGLSSQIYIFLSVCCSSFPLFLLASFLHSLFFSLSTSVVFMTEM